MSTGTLGIWHRIRQSRLLSFQRLFTCQLKRSSIKDVGKLQGEVLKIPEIYRGINIKKVSIGEEVPTYFMDGS